MAAKTKIRNGETELIAFASTSNLSNIVHRQSDRRSVIASASPVGSEIGIAQIESEIPSSPCRLDVLPSPTVPSLSLSLLAPSTLRQKVHDLFAPSTRTETLAILLNATHRRDELVWKANKAGRFSVKTAYQVALRLIQQDGAEH
uniref:Uncharacterized protein n=1 Tax=Quercus lobata TaxID=97700 RepID=A0A7N2KZP3_QUELO